MKTFKKISVLLSISFILTTSGCSSSDDAAPLTWDGAVNAGGYPLVEGVYVFNKSSLSGTCSDDNADDIPTQTPIPAESVTIVVNQNDDNQIVISDANVLNVPDFIVVSGTGSGVQGGTISKTGEFLTNRSAEIYNRIAGTAFANSYIDGVFTQNGLSGEIRLYLDIPFFFNAKCKLSGTFSGS